jgi:DNA-binding NarL/FixJ family response regulator
MERKSKMIVLWGREDLMVSSFKYYLASKKDWQVVSLSKKESFEVLDLAVKKTDPDFVIIRLGEYNITTLFPMQLIQEHPSMKVITVRLENNSMEVYGKNTKEIKKATDLIAVLDDKKSHPSLAFTGKAI